MARQPSALISRGSIPTSYAGGTLSKRSRH